MQWSRSRRSQRLLLAAACLALLAMVACLALTPTEAAPASYSANAPSSSASGESAEARAIRMRAEVRDRKIAEKHAAKQQQEAAAAAAAEEAARKSKQAAAKKEKAAKEAEANLAAKKKADATKAAPTPAATGATARAAEAAAKEYAGRAFSNEDAVDAAAEKARVARMEKDAKARAKVRSALPNAKTLERKRERAAAARHSAAQRKRVASEKALKRGAELRKQRRASRARRQDRIAAQRKSTDVRRRRRLEAAKPEIVARGAEKLKWMEQQVKGSRSDKVIDISYSNFKKYVHASPRPYWLFVVFTALGSRYSCSICTTVEPEMKKLAQLYHAEGARLAAERASNSSLVKVESDFENDQQFDAYRRDGMPIFFVQVDIEANGEVFRQLNMQSAPTMIVLNPTAAASPPAITQLLTSLPSKNRFQLTKPDINAGDLNEFIQKVTGRTVALTTAREPGLAGLISLVSELLNLMDPVRFLLLCVAGVMLCLLLVLWAGQRAWRAAKRYQANRARAAGVVTRELSPSDLVPIRLFSQYSIELLEQSRGTPSLTRSCFGVVAPGAFEKPRSLGLFRWWFVVVGCIVYLFGISGGMFNILRGNSSFSFDFLRNPRSFDIWRHIQQNDSHDQTTMEGLSLGVLQLVLASILILLNRMAFTERVVAAPGAPRTSKDRAIAVARWFGNCAFSPVLWATLFFLTWRLILAIYSKKNGSYRSGFVWKHVQPSHFAFLTRYAQQALGYLPRSAAQAILRWF